MIDFLVIAFIAVALVAAASVHLRISGYALSTTRAWLARLALVAIGGVLGGIAAFAGGSSLGSRVMAFLTAFGAVHVIAFVYMAIMPRRRRGA
ncbi:MAG: hypothetical protein M3Z21_11960 [Pseudomonadota bacterium]|nr:hypothetical protein [Pseudomonadota bacterium]